MTTTRDDRTEERAKAPTRREARAARVSARERFVKARRAERGFARQLTAVARQVGSIVRGLAPKGIVAAPAELVQTLRNYSDLIRPWSRAVASRMVSEVDRRDEHAWAEAGRELGRELRIEVRRAPTGQVMRALLDEQVELITSIPLKAAQRVHKLTIEAVTETGGRAREIAAEIMRTEEVTKSRAMLIARTETSRTVTALTQARAQHIGSTQYVWRTSGDSDVRESHRKMEGRVVAWDDPPTLDGLTGHAGALPNCRCYTEPIIPDELD